MTLIEALQRAPLFKEFGDSGLQTIAAMARERRLAAGEALFVEDSVGESLFVVKSGMVRLTSRAGGAEREIATVGPGGHLGDLGLLARSVRLVSAVAATECEVVELPRREFFRKAQEKPVTCLKLAAAIATELARKAGESKDALRALVAPREH